VSHLISLAACWSTSLERNSILFNGKVANVNEVNDNAKRILWSWFINREGRTIFYFRTDAVVPCLQNVSLNLTVTWLVCIIIGVVGLLSFCFSRRRFCNQSFMFLALPI
jgi:hypothetical protein